MNSIQGKNLELSTINADQPNLEQIQSCMLGESKIMPMHSRNLSFDKTDKHFKLKLPHSRAYLINPKVAINHEVVRPNCGGFKKQSPHFIKPLASDIQRYQHKHALGRNIKFKLTATTHA